MFARFSAAILATLAVVACSDSSGPSELSLAQLVGTWDLSRLEMVLASDTSRSQDVLASLDVSATLTINRSGSAVLVTRASGQPGMSSPATIGLRGDTLVFDVEGSGSTYEAIVRLAGRTMTWRSVETNLWDLDGDGTPEDVFERDVWQRQ
jgi:hypothetical protein